MGEQIPDFLPLHEELSDNATPEDMHRWFGIAVEKLAAAGFHTDVEIEESGQRMCVSVQPTESDTASQFARALYSTSPLWEFGAHSENSVAHFIHFAAEASFDPHNRPSFHRNAFNALIQLHMLRLPQEKPDLFAKPDVFAEQQFTPSYYQHTNPKSGRRIGFGSNRTLSFARQIPKLYGHNWEQHRPLFHLFAAGFLLGKELADNQIYADAVTPLQRGYITASTHFGNLNAVQQEYIQDTLNSVIPGIYAVVLAHVYEQHEQLAQMPEITPAQIITDLRSNWFRSLLPVFTKLPNGILLPKYVAIRDPNGGFPPTLWDVDYSNGGNDYTVRMSKTGIDILHGILRQHNQKVTRDYIHEPDQVTGAEHSFSGGCPVAGQRVVLSSDPGHHNYLEPWQIAELTDGQNPAADTDPNNPYILDFRQNLITDVFLPLLTDVYAGITRQDSSNQL